MVDSQALCGMVTAAKRSAAHHACRRNKGKPEGSLLTVIQAQSTLSILKPICWGVVHMNAASLLKRGLIGVVLVVIAILIASPESRAQDVPPKRQVLPPVSHAEYQELEDTPGAWESFLARFPQLGEAQATQNRVQVISAGTWTNVPKNFALN